jgi:hypothetical protein
VLALPDVEIGGLICQAGHHRGSPRPATRAEFPLKPLRINAVGGTT